MNYQDAHIIEETTNLGDSKLIDFVVDKADQLTEDKRGKILTEILIAGNYVSDETKFRGNYNENSEIIDGWLSKVNVPKLINNNQEFVQDRAKKTIKTFVRKNAAPFLVGAATGALIGVLAS